MCNDLVSLIVSVIEYVCISVSTQVTGGYA